MIPLEVHATDLFMDLVGTEMFPNDTKSILKILNKIVEEERERCAKVAEDFYSPVHTWASENSDRYQAQDEASRGIAAAIRKGETK